MRNIRVLSIILAAFVMLSAIPAQGQNRVHRFTFGAEWMYSSNYFNAHQFNYIAGEDGYRVNDDAGIFEYTSNGGILGHVGLNLGRCFNASVYAGYMGVYRSRNVFPVLAGLSWFPQGAGSDGFLVNLRAGVSFQEYIPVTDLSYLVSAGCGYRLSLAKCSALDFLLGLQTVFDHPPIPNPEGTGYVPAENIRKDNAQYLAVNLGISLSF